MSGHSMVFTFGNDVEKTSSGLKKTSRQPQKPAQVRSALDQSTSGNMLISSLLHKSAQAPRKRDPNATYRSQGSAEEKTPALTLEKEKKDAEEKEGAYLARNKTVEKSTITTGPVNRSGTDVLPTCATPSTLHTNKEAFSKASRIYHGSEALKALSSLNINMATAILTVTRGVDFKISVTISGFSKERKTFGTDMADRKKHIFSFTGQQDFSDFITKKNNVPIFNKFLPIGRSTEEVELPASAYGRAVDGVLNFLDYKSKKDLGLEVKMSDEFFITARMTGLRLSLNEDSTGEKKMTQWGFIMAKSVTQDLRKVPSGATTSDEDDFIALEVEAAIAAALKKEIGEIYEVECNTTSMSPAASITPLHKKPLHKIMGSLPGTYSALNTSGANTDAPDCDATVNAATDATNSKKVPKSNLNTNIHVFALHNVPMPDHRELLAKARVPAWEQQAQMQSTGARPTFNDFGDEVMQPTADEILAKAIFDHDTKVQHEVMEREAAQLEEAERKKAAAAIKWKHGRQGIRYRLQGDHVHAMPQGRSLRDAVIEANLTQQLADAKCGGRQAIWEKEMGFVEEEQAEQQEEMKVLKNTAKDTPAKEPKKRLSLAEYKAAKAMSKKEQGKASPAPAAEEETLCEAPAQGKDTEGQASAQNDQAQKDAMDDENSAAVRGPQPELTAHQEKQSEQVKTLALEKARQDGADAREADAKAVAAEEEAKVEVQAAGEHAKVAVGEDEAKIGAAAQAEKAKVDTNSKMEQQESISTTMPRKLKPFDSTAAALLEMERHQDFLKQVQEQEEGWKRDEERHRQRRMLEAAAAESNNAEGSLARTSATAARPQHSGYSGKIPRKGPSGTPTEQPISSPESRPQHNGHATESPSLVNTAAAATEQTESTSAAPKSAKRKSEEADVETEPMKDSFKKAKITKTTSAKRVTARQDSPEPIAGKHEMEQVSHKENLHTAPDVDTSGATLSDDDISLGAMTKGTKRMSEDESMSPPAKRRQPSSSTSGQGLNKPTKKGFGEVRKKWSGKTWDDRVKGCEGDAAQDAIDEAEFAAVLAKNAPQSKKKNAAAGTKSPAVEISEKDLQEAFKDGTLKAKLNGHSRPEIWNWVKEIGGGIGNGLSKVTKADLITGIVEGCRVKFAGLQQQRSASHGGGHRQGGQTQRRRSSPEPVRRDSKPDPLHRPARRYREAHSPPYHGRQSISRQCNVANAMSQLKPSYAPGSGPWVRAEEKQARREATSAGTMFDVGAFQRATAPAIQVYEHEQAENARKWAEADAKEKAQEKAKERAAARPRQQISAAARGSFYESYRPSPEAGPTAAQREVEATRTRNLSRREAAIVEVKARRQLDYQ
ncbi:hypothetical protein TI39_contig491g00003 [Zymoseptoria brevis]|uniref:Uncharacterized protein n=1 Tax=Zymoseptoria brevis TaxID=1047168 RepID=A0A0F4GJ44_9PEZI|nr:hypothetical protein TI39_contig491g00003 [Zymoseptoria brevis]